MLGELSEKECEDLLKSRSVGRIGCTDGNEVYIVPVNYRYLDKAILCYSLEGHKIDIMRKNHTVCFEVDNIKDANHWRSVIINGKYEELTDDEEVKTLRALYTEYVLRKRVSLTALPNSSESDNSSTDHSQSVQVFYKINIIKMSGRYEEGFL